MEQIEELSNRLLRLHALSTAIADVASTVQGEAGGQLVSLAELLEEQLEIASRFASTMMPMPIQALRSA